MSGPTDASLKVLCNELARKLVTNPSRQLLEMTLRHSVLARARSAPPAEASSPLSAAAAPLAGPQPISLWQPQVIDGELVFVRPEAGALGDGYCQRRVIPQRKTARRVCFFGESAAQGFLHAPHLTPAKVLEQQLNAVAGSGSGAGAYEVVDLSKSSESMLPLLETMKRALQLEPDALVVFTGNNWNFQESDASPYIPVPALRARYARALRQGGVAGVRELAARSLEGKARQVLRAIAELAAPRSIPVLVVVPEVNLADWESRQPVVWRSGDATARWHQLQARALRGLATSEHAAALAAAEQMLEIDEGTNPSAYRIQATAYRALGRFDDAARAARAEVDADLLPTMCYLHGPQATTLVKETLRQASREHGFTIVDLPEVFAAHADATEGAAALPGRRFFLDYCHLTAEGMNVAMAATASALLRVEGRADLSWQALLRAVPRVQASPRGDAVAMFGAAIHSAHRLLAISNKAEILEYWCGRALTAAPELAEAMLELIELRCRPGPALLSRALHQGPAAELLLLLEHGLQWPSLDVELIEAICSALEQRGVPARARVARLLIEHLAVDRGGERAGPPVELAAAELLRWDLNEAIFADVLNLDDSRHRAAYRAVQPSSSFCLVASGAHELELTIAARLPELGEAVARRGPITVDVNGVIVATFEGGVDWSAERHRVPAAALRAGINKLTLHWPPPPPVGEAALAAAIERLERGLAAELHPVFGEVFSLLARRWTEPAV